MRDNDPFDHRHDRYFSGPRARTHADDAYATWTSNDMLDHTPRRVDPSPVPTAQDFCAIAAAAVTAGLIPPANAAGVARTLWRSYLAAPTADLDRAPLSAYARRAHGLPYQPVTYDAKRLRAAAMAICAATYGHEDPTLESQRVLAAILKATA